MAITSEQIAAIINQQQQGFAAAQGHTSAVASMAPYSGSEEVVDPRAPRSVDQGIQAAGVGGMIGKAVGFGGEAMTLTAGFGFAPRVLDPLTNALSWGLKGKAAAGWGGAFAMGGVAYAASSALTAPIGFAASNITQGAQERGFLNAQLGNMMPNMGASQLGMLSSQLEGMNRGGMGGLQELTSIMGAGAATGALNISSIAEFQASFQRLVSDAKQMATTLKVSLTEGYQALESVKSMGLNTGQAQSLVGSFHGLGQASGLGPAQLFNAAAGGAQLAQQAGISAFTGAMGAVTNESLIGMTARTGALGGVNAGANAQFTSAAYSFFNQRQGQQVLAAMMSDTGGLDPVMAQRVAAGVVGKEELTEAARRNTTGKMRDIFTSRNQELAAQFVSDYGPQSIMGGLKATTSGSDMQQSVMQALTGMNRHDLSIMDQVAASTPMLKARLMEEARAGASEGQQRQSIGDIISKAIDKFTRPYRDKFRIWGEGITQSVQETVESFTNEFLSPSNAPMGMGALQSLRMDSAFGRMSGPAVRPMQQSMASMLGVRQAGSGFGASAAQFLPSGLRAGAMGVDGDLSQLPMYGFGNEAYSGAQTALSGGIALDRATAALSAGGLGLGGEARGALWGLGEGVSGVGRGIMRGIGAVGAGSNMATGMGRFLEGWAGRAIGTGVAASAGGAMKFGGMLMRGASRLATGPVGTALMAYDLAENIAPGVMRSAGFSEQTEGAVSGSFATGLAGMESELVKAGLADRVKVGGGVRAAGEWLGGVFNSTEVARVYSPEDMQNSDLIPVSGTLGENNTQMVLRKNKVREFNDFFQNQAAEAQKITAAAPGSAAAAQRGARDGLSAQSIAANLQAEYNIPADKAIKVANSAVVEGKRKVLRPEDVRGAKDEVIASLRQEVSGRKLMEEPGFFESIGIGMSSGAGVGASGATTKNSRAYNAALAMFGDSEGTFAKNHVNFMSTLPKLTSANEAELRERVKKHYEDSGISGYTDAEMSALVNMDLAGGFGTNKFAQHIPDDLLAQSARMRDEYIESGGRQSGGGLDYGAAAGRFAFIEESGQLGAYQVAIQDKVSRAEAEKRISASFYAVGMRGNEAAATYASFAENFNVTDYRKSVGDLKAGTGEMMKRGSAMSNARLAERLFKDSEALGGAQGNALFEVASTAAGMAQVQSVTERHRGKKKDSVAVVAELTGGMSPNLDASLGEYFSGKKSQFSQQAENELRNRAKMMLGNEDTEENINALTQRLLQLGKAQASGDQTQLKKAQLALGTVLGTHGMPVNPKAGDPIKFAASVTAVTDGLEKLARALNQLPPQNISGGGASGG